MLFAGGLLLLLFLCGSIGIAMHTNLVSPPVMNFTYDTYTLYGGISPEDRYTSGHSTWSLNHVSWLLCRCHVIY